MENFSITPDLLKRFDIPGPRYTSYPTADRFADAFDSDAYLQALSQRHVGAVGGTPLSIYVHVPFCESLCYYCGCNKIITKHHERAKPYLEALKREIGLVCKQMQTRQRVSQLHFGGGSPTFLTDEELADLMAYLREHFEFLDVAECTIEVDPRTVTQERLQKLWDMGLNRLSFGVQDFDPKVQEAVHRVQSTQSVFDLVRAAREIGFQSISVDLIYGLPHQSLESFTRTLDTVVELRPDRLAIYGYAHLPTRFMPQRRINVEDLPTGGTRLALMSKSIELLQQAGYDYIGMDHFALPQDSLSQAKRQGNMHRNFQGYSTHADCDLIGLGVSAISKVGSVYCQNAKEIEEYQAFIEKDQLPVVRGVVLSRDDLIRRAVISSIMCQGDVVFESIDLAYMIDFKSYFAYELEQLKAYVGQKFLVLDNHGLQVTPLGWYFVRALAMTFDKYLQVDKPVQRFSRII